MNFQGRQDIANLYYGGEGRIGGRELRAHSLPRGHCVPYDAMTSSYMGGAYPRSFYFFIHDNIIEIYIIYK